MNTMRILCSALISLCVVAPVTAEDVAQIAGF
jgi:hypothetical protein